MCETLFFGVVGDADDFRRFKKAYNEGGLFAGIPQDIAQGLKEGGILAVDVLRTCDADTTPGRERDVEVQRHRGQPPGRVRPGVRRLHVLRAADLREARGLQHVGVHPERRAGVLVGGDLVQGAGRLPAGADLRGVDAGAGRDVAVRPERRACGPGLARAARGCGQRSRWASRWTSGAATS